MPFHKRTQSVLNPLSAHVRLCVINKGLMVINIFSAGFGNHSRLERCSLVQNESVLTKMGKMRPSRKIHERSRAMNFAAKWRALAVETRHSSM